MVKGGKALGLAMTLLMGGAGVAEAASQLLCGMRWSSANEAVDQRLGGDCMLVTAEGRCACRNCSSRWAGVAGRPLRLQA